MCCAAQGRTVGEVCQRIGVLEQSYHCWRKEYGGLKVGQARRLNYLEAENARLEPAVAKLTLDKLLLKEAKLLIEQCLRITTPSGRIVGWPTRRPHRSLSCLAAAIRPPLPRVHSPLGRQSKLTAATKRGGRSPYLRELYYILRQVKTCPLYFVFLAVWNIKY